MRRISALVALCLLLAGCEVSRPDAVACTAPTEGVLNFLPVEVSQSVNELDFVPSMINVIQQVARAAPEGPVTVNVLSLSSGGQYGAFGAGFLRGWSENTATPRPDFDLVTGVSAGALMAPIAFAGPEFDHVLDKYRGLAQADVYRPYPPLLIPLRSSVASTEPLNRLLREQLTDAMIDRIGQRSRDEGAQLIVSAANLDTTENKLFDLGLAAEANTSFAQRRNCMVEPMLASAAIPGLFPPRNIGGELYADGGLRDHVFFQAVESARAQLAIETGRDLRIEATIIVNGALSPPEQPVENSILNYVTRSTEILADEVLRDSIAKAVNFAENSPGWRIKGIFAEVDVVAAGCDADQTSGTIDPCVTAVLFDTARALGKTAPINWKSATELLEKSNEF